ncbi:MAG: SAM-dependent chlorinase/fluorinase [Solobacterium sp.]|nr:SAM-dependent chlorinase/fluorinase [Solobacterium sp.]
MMQEVLPLLVFQTDFTYMEGAVASMYGVVRSVSRDVEIITATHDLPQYDIWSASYRLQQYVEFWPKGTVFVSVVDPGVGTERKACAACTEDGYYIITPDNGSLTHILRKHGIAEVREIDETVNRLASTRGTSVFHGRDLFGYCAAKLASGKITFEEVGPAYPVQEIVTMPVAEPVFRGTDVSGIIEIDDPNFGNVWTNIPLKEFQNAGYAFGEDVHITIEVGGQTAFDEIVRFDRTFGNVAEGKPVLYNNEQMNLSLAVCRGSFKKTYGIGFGADHIIRIGKTNA